MLPEPTDEVANISLAFAVPPEIQSLVSSAKAVVSAVDMDTIRQTLTVTPTSVSGTIADIPSGLNRKFEIFVYDSNGDLTYQGEASTKVEANQTIILNITLIPVNHTGTVIINGTFQQNNSDERIVFLSDQNGSDDIYIMDGNGNNQTRLTTTVENETHPHISSDRSRICFTREVNGLIRPFVMNADGSDEQELPFHSGATVTHLVWSPDGKDIVLSSDASGAREIYIYNVSSEDLTQLTSNGARNWLPTWSPDGQTIGWASDQIGQFKTYLMNRDGTAQKRLTTTSGIEERAQEFSPDGNSIVFVGRATSAWDLYRIDSDGSNFEQITFTTGLNEIHHCWSPDGQFILTHILGNESGLYLIDVQDNYSVEVFLDEPGVNEDHAHWR